jgi:KaiC/GvpD/RAD55 family RecA-like ATPase
MMLQTSPTMKMRLALCSSEHDQRALNEAGIRSVRVVQKIEDIYRFSQEHAEYQIDDTLGYFSEFILAFADGEEQLRDDLAVRLGDTNCRWVRWPKGVTAAADFLDTDPTDLANLVQNARPMWTDEICTIDDIPEPGEEKTYKTGFPKLDAHGLRLVRPAFMPVIGPYASGKSVVLRQLAVNLWRLHGWRTLITSFEEKVKPRFERDLRRHLIGRQNGGNNAKGFPVKPWSDEDVAKADAEIRQAFRFLRRKRNTVLDLDRLVNRIEYAVKVYGIEVVMIDPVNEIDHQVPRGETRTDYMGKFIMRLKQLADDYSLLMIVAAHPPKDGVEKRLQKTGLLTLNDGADTAHYGNKADMGWCVWRNIDGPTLLHVDKVKDHETMGKPTLVELIMDSGMNAFVENRIGFDILGDDA